MGFWKRIIELLIFSSEYEGQSKLTSEFSSLDRVGPLSEGFPKPAGSCNTRDNRKCWTDDGFNIITDYEIQTPKGEVRNFYLVITNETIAPDGYKVQRMLFNGTYPGPTLEGNWGDTFSHFSLQYADGLVGALKINGPTSMNYDEDLGPVLITDNYHKTAFSQIQLEYLGRPPAPDSFLMNGKGKYYCCPKLDKEKLCVGGSQRESFNFEEGKTYKMSLVNTGTATHMTFWIDNHDFMIVAADFVPITPRPAKILNIAIGQRYDIIVKANAREKSKETDFWIHARDCAQGGAPSNLGIIRYNPNSHYIPHTPPIDEKHVCYGCLDEISKTLEPIVPRKVELPANMKYIEESFKVHLTPDKVNPQFHKWVLKDSTFQLDWAEPSLSLVKVAYDKGWTTMRFPEGYEPVYLNYTQESWVYWLIEGKFKDSLDDDPSSHKMYKNQAPVAHPMHIHGHDFVILAQSEKEFDGTVDLSPEVRNNPTRRDVALLPVDGHLLIAFQMNNPGVWLMHCHIAWHASGGLALQFIESPKDIGPAFAKSGRMPQFAETCTNWAAHYTLFNKFNDAVQDDSGI
ncbi:hypothetical protein COL154_006363 [Colletotrichum chrysophilum]|nr:hypothetical protein COL154_006363 [Colletotrichum chrysophilum]